MPGPDRPLRLDALLAAATGELTARRLLPPLAVTVGGAALYGAVLGSWHGGRLALYAALKLPLVLLLTGLATVAFQAVAARLLGERLRLVEVAWLVLSALAVLALLLASLVPVAALATVSFPRPTTEAHTAHNLLYLLHTGLVGASGLAGTAALWGALRRRCESARAARRIFAVWVLSLALVGGEVAWALRPFVGSVFEPVALLRRDALDGNVYEFVFTDILPWLAGGEPSGDRPADDEETTP